MKIMHESKKEALPLDFITSFVSKSWEEIGNIKANIEGIHQAFTGTGKIEEILQNLVDAYLICVGQLELYIDKKDYLDLPSIEKINESLNEEVEDENKTPLDILKDKVDIHSEEDTIIIAEKGQLDNPDAPKIEVEASEEEKEILEPEFHEEEPKQESLKESFEFFTDFDEPEKLDEGYTPFKEWTSTHNN
jgi:hypothetical protein